MCYCRVVARTHLLDVELCVVKMGKIPVWFEIEFHQRRSEKVWVASLKFSELALIGLQFL
jgi:hypothetical protein